MKLVCWHCGDSLDGLPRPIRSQMRCPHCRADLHVCRMCRHHDTRYIGHCSHEQADRVLDKESANYCTFYSPRADAYVAWERGQGERARRELDALFGSEVEQADPEDGEADAESPQARARREADSLFDFGKKPRGGE